jgi:hypothetical protein
MHTCVIGIDFNVSLNEQYISVEYRIKHYFGLLNYPV